MSVDRTGVAPEPVRAVLDTSILVAGLRSRNGASYALLRHLAAGRVILLVTTALFLEYEAVLTREQHLVAAGLDVEVVRSFLTALAKGAEAVEVHFGWRPQLVDPNDEMVLEAAVNGRATVLVTHNVRHFAEPGPRFGIEVIPPAVLVRRLVA